MSTWLIHHGVQGQQWGVRNGPPYPLSRQKSGRNKFIHENLKNSLGRNLESFGKSENTNVLYITGLSGSGKSTVSLGLKKKNDVVIHLDGYTESQNIKVQNKKFNTYLNKKVPGWKEIYKQEKVTKFSDDYWDLVDKFTESIKEYGKYEFKKGNRVIVEGIQLFDGWFTLDKKYFLDKPLLVLNTKKELARKRAQERDKENKNKNPSSEWDDSYILLEKFISNNKLSKRRY